MVSPRRNAGHLTRVLAGHGLPLPTSRLLPPPGKVAGGPDRHARPLWHKEIAYAPSPHRCRHRCRHRRRPVTGQALCPGWLRPGDCCERSTQRFDAHIEATWVLGSTPSKQIYPHPRVCRHCSWPSEPDASIYSVRSWGRRKSVHRSMAMRSRHDRPSTPVPPCAPDRLSHARAAVRSHPNHQPRRPHHRVPRRVRLRRARGADAHRGVGGRACGRAIPISRASTPACVSRPSRRAVRSIRSSLHESATPKRNRCDR